MKSSVLNLGLAKTSNKSYLYKQHISETRRFTLIKLILQVGQFLITHFC